MIVLTPQLVRRMHYFWCARQALLKAKRGPRSPLWCALYLPTAPPVRRPLAVSRMLVPRTHPRAT
jgi:hypothetical protein